MRTASWLASLGLAAATLLPLAAGAPIPIVQVLDLSGPNGDTDRKFNRMRPSMARVLGLETRSAKEG